MASLLHWSAFLITVLVRHGSTVSGFCTTPQQRYAMFQNLASCFHKGILWQCLREMANAPPCPEPFTPVSKWDAVKNHPAWRILSNYDCGDSAADRIIGGFDAALGQFPWIVRLGYISQEDNETDFKCGAALLTDRHVVTAAHCLTNKDEESQLTSVRLGEHDIRTNPDCQLRVCAPKVQDRNIKISKRHPQFDKPPFHNDIAILELEFPVEINNYVTPICLPREEQIKDRFQQGELLTVAGWGTTNMSTEERADILQYVGLPVVKPEACNTFQTFGWGFNVTESEICAGTEHNKDACKGDSGGPLMKIYDTPDGPKHFIVGVVSFGPTLCGNKKPGVYASVGYFLKWILDNIAKFEH
ncbi:phenoloxidase-activating factor 1-like [Hyposmocoma kahamanoa]|uniref:phenoloxidase-activating factor 1-like n=1 Tax=Hyposmocoma kahamanoa TaxID=1477025 RepID=UPI000E6DA38D|nr:phenoloxidase-activating factor 1-like [Hyposmocoma kahamanoa]